MRFVGCAGTEQFLQGNINETSCWQPWSAWAQKQARGCIRWQSAGLAGSNPDLAHGNLISEKPQIFISSSTASSDQTRPEMLGRQATSNRLHVRPAGMRSFSVSSACSRPLSTEDITCLH